MKQTIGNITIINDDCMNVLYKWLLSRYANRGDKILDTHLGSGSICIAAYDLGFEITGIEIDEYYYHAAAQRLLNHQKQTILQLI